MPSRFFDLIELDGGDLRREPIESRKAALLKLLRKSDYGIFLNEHVDRVSARVQAWVRRHCVKASRIAVCVWAISALAQTEKSKQRGCQMRVG
jgi:hypothetical protein